MKLKSAIPKIDKIILNEMYLFMLEMINKENHYPYEKVRNYDVNYWRFISRYKTEHRIRLLINKDIKTKSTVHEIKFGIYDAETNTIDYNQPGENDEKVFNTHVKIAVDEIIGRHAEIGEYRLPVIDEDPRRARLYRIALNKYIDKKDWDISIDKKNTIHLKRK